MRVLERSRRDALFESSRAAGKLMIGLSAGSLMLAKEWVAFPDDDDTKAPLSRCIGAAPVHVDAHAEEDDWHENARAPRLLETTRRSASRGVGLRRRVSSCPRRRRDDDADGARTPLSRFAVRHGKVVATSRSSVNAV